MNDTRLENFKCLACSKQCYNGAEINTHLANCDMYDEWYKKYTPPKIIECNKCKLNFYENTHSLCKGRFEPQ